MPSEGWGNRQINRLIERVNWAVSGGIGCCLYAVHANLDATRRSAAARAGDAPIQEFDRCGAAGGGALIDECEEVGVGQLLLHVGEGDRFAVEGIERLSTEVVTEFSKLCLQATAARELPDRQAGANEANRLRRHDFVGEWILQHAVLMDPRLMREGIRANNRLVRLHRESGQI